MKPGRKVLGMIFDEEIDHEESAKLKRRKTMRCEVGEKVVLRDDLSKRHFTNMEDIEGKELRITHIDHLNENYCSGPYLFTDGMIDHDKTAELKKAALDESETNEITGNIYQDMHPAKVRELLSTPKDAIDPAHYRNGEIDRIEVWYLTMPFDGFRWAMKSHIDKYAYRYEKKNGIEDLDKMMFFAERLKEYELKEREEEHARD